MNGLAETKAKELNLWNLYRDSGFQDDNTLQELLESTKPIRVKSILKWQGPVPKSIIEGEAVLQSKKAFESFDPNKAALGTHLTNQLQALSRTAYDYSNLAKIPEPRLIKINTFQNAQANLQDKLGREANALELAEELSWPLAEVERMRKEIRKDLFTTGMPVSTHSFTKYDRTQQYLNYLYYEADRNEKRLMEYVFGFGGKPLVTENNQLAEKLKLPLSEIVRMKKKLTKRIREM